MPRTRRAKAACQKCRSLKHKCDFKFPNCSRCERAKIDCIVQDPITKEFKKRAQYGPPKHPEYNSLESSFSNNSKILKLSKKLERYEKLLQDAGVEYLDDDNSFEFEFELGISISKMIPFGFRSEKLLDTKNISMFGNGNQNNQTELLMTKLVKLPDYQTTLLLVDNYFKFSWPQYPILTKGDTIERKIEIIFKVLDSRPDIIFGNVQNYLRFLSDNFDSFTLFTLYMIIAISTAINQVPNLSFSTNYFISSTMFLNKFLKKDIQTYRISSEMESSNIELKSIQCFLLITVFGLFEPIKPGVWYMICICSGLVIDMDLQLEEKLIFYEEYYKNKESSDYLQLNQLYLDDLNKSNYNNLHRQIFWTTFALERQICGYVNKPLLISDLSISSKMNLKERQNDPDYMIPSFFFQLRCFQGETIQALNKTNSKLNPLTYVSVEEYALNMHLKMNDLISTYIDMNMITKDSNMKLKLSYVIDFALLNYFFILQTLYKPSSSRPRLSEPELVLLFTIADQIVCLYDKLVSSNRINFTYLSVSSIHQACMSLFYTLMNFKQLYQNRFILEYTQQFIDKVLKIMNFLTKNCGPAGDVLNSITKVYDNVRDAIIKRQLKLKDRDIHKDQLFLQFFVLKPNKLEDYILRPINFAVQGINYGYHSCHQQVKYENQLDKKNLLETDNSVPTQSGSYQPAFQSTHESQQQLLNNTINQTQFAEKIQPHLLPTQNTDFRKLGPPIAPILDDSNQGNNEGASSHYQEYSEFFNNVLGHELIFQMHLQNANNDNGNGNIKNLLNISNISNNSINNSSRNYQVYNNNNNNLNSNNLNNVAIHQNIPNNAFGNNEKIIDPEQAVHLGNDEINKLWDLLFDTNFDLKNSML